MSFCTKCGHKLPSEANFCLSCGTPVASGGVAPEKLKAEDEIEELIQDLNINILSIQKRAAEELGKIGDSRAVEPLLNTLHDEHKDVRKKACVALGKIGDRRAVEPLIEVLKDDDMFVSIEAAKALSEIGGDRAVEALVKTVKEDRRYYEPSEELQLLGAEDVWIVKEAAEALGKTGEPAVKPLIGLLREVDWMARVYVVKTLVEIGDIRAVEPLIKALKYSADDIVKAVVKVGGVRAVEPLIQAIKDPNAAVRNGAAQALGMIADTRAVKPLIEALKDEAEPVQREAALALNMIGGEEAEKAVKASAKFQFLLWPSFENAMKTRDIEGLLKLLMHKKKSIRQHAVSGLEELGWTPRDNTEQTHYLIAKDEWYELSKLGEITVEPLLQILKDGDGHTRSRAAYALGMTGDKRAVEPLTQALTDEDVGVQNYAYQALRDIKIAPLEKKRDVEGLIRALQDNDRYIRSSAAQALGRLRDARAVEPLNQALNDRSVIVRIEAKQALEKIQNKNGD